MFALHTLYDVVGIDANPLIHNPLPLVNTYIKTRVAYAGLFIFLIIIMEFRRQTLLFQKNASFFT